MAAESRQAGPSGPAEYVAPQNQDAEESVLGAIMLSRTAVAAAAEECSPEDFYIAKNGKVFRAALTLHARGEPVDAITLVAELERRGDLEDVGGKVRVGELAALVPASSNIRHYAKLVRDCALRRALLVDLQRISQQVLSGEWEADQTADRLRAVADASGTEEIDPSIRVMGVREFVEQPLADTEALMGEDRDRIIVPKSLNILGGPGGTGKTTLALHLAFHLCAGVDWLGMKVQRPVRMLLLENEGPHDLFAEKVKEFRDRWDGPSVDDTMFIHDAPWGHFTWDDKRKASELRAIARDHEVDLLLANPLNRLGMKGAGTPEETNAFLDLLVRGGHGDDFGVFLIHHTRKPPAKPHRNGNGSGEDGVDELSGAWGPHPDLAMMLRSDGTRRVVLSFPKVRWGKQDAHGPFVLHFEEDDNQPVGYRMKDTSTERVGDGDLLERIDEALRKARGPLSISEIKARVTGNNGRITIAVNRGVESGRYSKSGTGRGRFSLADPDEPRLADASTVEEITGQLADELGTHDVPLELVRERMKEEGYQT